jgi:hypothetical protein
LSKKYHIIVPLIFRLISKISILNDLMGSTCIRDSHHCMKINFKVIMLIIWIENKWENGLRYKYDQELLLLFKNNN